MAEEVQVEAVQSAEPAQPVGPSTEAPVVAAVAAPAEDPLAKFQERLSRQQAVLERNRAAAEKAAQTERERADAIQAQLDQERMKGMTEAERLKFQAQKAQEQFEVERQSVLQERQAVEEDKVYLQWYSWFLSQGVPADKLAQCRDFPEMQTAFANYKDEQLAAYKQPPAPQAPAVGAGDKVHTGGFGAPPSLEFHRLMNEGHGPGSKEYREYLKKMKRSGAKELI